MPKISLGDQASVMIDIVGGAPTLRGEPAQQSVMHNSCYWHGPILVPANLRPY